MNRRSVLRWLGLVPVAAPVAVAAAVRVASDSAPLRTAPVLREVQARAAADTMLSARIDNAAARIIASETRICAAFEGGSFIVPNLITPTLPPAA